ncbi:hypothetical protein HDC94_002777 [Leifsonia sp. AK011]|uniref:hypothetical protein n=1 Tax=Leifsonia sp. AK011 TaxID=2723075 RepID=UPI0015CD68A3|nr:hypothetical protein [Leifsonia sp. AK011]NYF11621.1 hypothetical protein [Leifsonia sp. AK011]
MNDANHAIRPPLSRLGLEVTFPPDGRDDPHLSIRVDGVELSLLSGSQIGFIGFPADQILPAPALFSVEDSWINDDWDPSDAWAKPPLLQSADAQRIALYTCSCGTAGCGVIAPIIATDGDVVTWTDFRDFTGVFVHPDDPSDGYEGELLPMDQVRFDASQYREEVMRIALDRSWESPSRVTARILAMLLEEHHEVIADAGYRVGWVASAWWKEGAGRFEFTLERVDARSRNYVIGLTAKFGTPSARARSMMDRLLKHPVEEWFERFPGR